MKFPEPLHTGPHTGARTGPRIGPHTGPTAGPARIPSTLPGQTGYRSVGDSPKYISNGREDKPAEPVTHWTPTQPADRWSTRDLNAVPEAVPPFGSAPRQRSSTTGVKAAEGTPAPTTLGASAVPFWPRTIRLTERWVITEKIDGTHAILVICQTSAEDTAEPGVTVTAGPGGRMVTVRAASRTRWLVPEHLAREGDGRDNFGFAAWVAAHAAELAVLGPGDHHGEWYGSGIGRGYGLTGHRFALFDTGRWQRGLPLGVPEELGLVPVLAQCEGGKLNATVTRCLTRLEKHGSQLMPGAAAEGVIASSAADTRLALKAYVAGVGMRR